MTLTNGEGCGCVIPGTGIEVNNLLGEADINPRGFHCDPPGTRMATMMARPWVYPAQETWWRSAVAAQTVYAMRS